jgi:hypothetical protein
VLLVEAVLPRMEEDSRIVLIGSTAGLDDQGGPYAAAKITRIAANANAPGLVADTEFFEAGTRDGSCCGLRRMSARSSAATTDDDLPCR